AQAVAKPNESPAIPINKEVQLALLRKAFIPFLARIDTVTGRPMRRVARIDEIPSDSLCMVQRLVSARLLVADRRSDVDGFGIAQESLLRLWPALVEWLEVYAEDLKCIESVERAAAEWARHGRREGWLDHRDERLSSAQRVTADFRERLSSKSRDYL